MKTGAINSTLTSRHLNTKNENVGREEILSLLGSYLLPEDLERVETAYIFAKYGHRNQTRDSGVRYFEHPKSVALITIEELNLYMDWKLIAMSLLHDIGEDSFILSWKRIQINFGKEIAFGTKLLTKIRGETHTAYVERILQHGSKRVFIVKLCDRLHNLRTLASCPDEKIKRKVEETEKLYIPLVKHLIAILPNKGKERGEYLFSKISFQCKKHREVGHF